MAFHPFATAAGWSSKLEVVYVHHEDDAELGVREQARPVLHVGEPGFAYGSVATIFPNSARLRVPVERELEWADWVPEFVGPARGPEFSWQSYPGLRVAAGQKGLQVGLLGVGLLMHVPGKQPVHGHGLRGLDGRGRG